MKKVILSCFVAASIFLSSTGFAQNTTVSGYNLQVFRPAGDGNSLFNTSRSKTLKQGQFHTGFFLNYSDNLLTAGNLVGPGQTEIVQNLLTADLLAGVGLFDFLDVGVALPVHLTSSQQNFATTTKYSTTGIGDLRVNLKAQLLKDKEWWPGIGFMATVALPTGDRMRFFGDPGAPFEGRLLLDKEIGLFTLIANVGYRFVDRENIINIIIDDQLTFGAGVDFTVPAGNRTWHVGTEVSGYHVVKNSRELTTPVEILGGVRKDFEKSGLSLQVLGGAGLTSGAGSPNYRVGGGLTYTFGKKGKKEKAPQFEAIYFPTGSSKIAPSYHANLDKLAAYLAKHPGRVIQISGLTDPTGSAASNQRLSLKRAKAVQAYLVKKGVKASQIQIQALGETKATGQRSQDRRAEFSVGKN